MKCADKSPAMSSARGKLLDEGVLKRLNEAAEDHASSVIDLVVSKLSTGSSLKASQINSLKRLWHEQLQDLKAQNEHDMGILPAVTTPSDRLIPPHPRLLEPVQCSQSIHGCIGRPVAFLKPPEYVSQQRKSDRKWKTEDEAGVTKKLKSQSKRTEPTLSSTEVQEQPAASDLVLGMKVNVDVNTFLRVTPTAGTQWVAGRVVSIIKPPNTSRANTSKRSIRVRVRFPNGGEMETFWPGNPLLQVPDAPLISSIASASAGNLTEHTQQADQQTGQAVPEESSDSIFARMLRGEDSDSDNDLNGLNDLEQDLMQRGGEGDALRILLGGDDDSIGASCAEMHPRGASSSQQRFPHNALVNDAQLRSVHSGGTFSNILDAHSMRALPAPLEGVRTKEVALLATGERVAAFSLGEIERKFEHYRPRFKITPDQGDAGLEIQAAVRRDRSFASRQWTTNTSHTSSQSSAYAEDETGLEAQLLNIVLNPADDPSVPLPEPEAVFIGKVAKQLRRGETQWRAQLFDVAVRDLRRTNTTNTTDPTSTATSAVEPGCGVDMILPRCSIRLDPTALFPLEDLILVAGSGAEGGGGMGGVDVGGVDEGGVDGGGVGGGEDVIQDPVSRENRALLFALTSQ